MLSTVGNLVNPCRVFSRSQLMSTHFAMATSDHEWDFFLDQEAAVQAEYGSLGRAQGLGTWPEQGKEPHRTVPQPGTIFELGEFRQDGQRRLL